MKTDWKTIGRMAGRTWLGVLALAGGLPAAGLAQQTVYWRNGAGVSNWWDGANPWYRSCDGWWIARPDYNVCNNNSTIGANIVRFDNGSDLAMSLNGAYFQVHQLLFDSGTGARTMTARDGGGIDMRSGSSTVKIENNDADAQTLNAPVVMYAATEINPVSGNLTLQSTLNNGGYWVNVWGNNAKTLYLNGAVSGAGGLAVKQNSTVVLTNANTFNGGLWIEKGKVQIGTSTNAPGTGTVNVGTNATLDIQHGSATLVPAALVLYNGQATKATTSGTTWQGALTNYNSSTCSVTAGNLYVYGGIAVSSGTLVFSNVNASGMGAGGTLTGSGNLEKWGTGDFRLYPGTHSGNINLKQGAMWQYSGTMGSSGTLVMEDGTTYRADSTTARTMAKAGQINGNVTLGYSGGGALTLAGDVNLNGGTRTLTTLNDVAVSGTISNGGLTKAGSGTTLVLTGANTYASATTISAGTLQIGNNGTTGSVAGDIANNAALVWYRSDSPTYSGAISGTGTLAKQGAGTLTLSGTSSSYGGATTVSTGTLLVSGSLGSSAVTVASGATLAGAGSVGSIATLAGTVSPGNSAGAAGTLTLAGAAALGGGTYACDITGTGSTACDKIAAGGAIAAASTFTINLPTSAPSGFDACSSYSWTILGGSSVNVANMVLGAKWTTSGTFGLAVSGNTIVVTHTPAAPAQPGGLSASDGSSTAQVALSWTDGACESSYVVWRNTVNNFGSSSALFTNAANVATYNDAGATPGQLYYYFVTATNVSGSSAASVGDSGYRRLAAPGNVAATDGASTANVTVTWDAATGATSYHLYRDTDSTPAGATPLGPQTSGYVDAGATPGQLYYYWVVASNSASGSTSDWSTANSGYVKLASPGSVAATENLSDRVTVTWGNVTGETGFGIWRHTSDVSGSATCIGGVAADVLAYDDTTATAGQAYYYWVRATNATSASMSDFSASDLGMKTLTEPTTPASAIVFSAVAPASLTIGWTRGNGDSVLVVAKQGSAPADPADSTVYNANAAFGSGDPTAAGSYVVYKGTGTAVPVTGLAAGTDYYFAVYEFNGTTTPNYRTGDEPVSNKFTLAAEPATQAANMAIGGIDMASLSGFTWTDGSGAGRMLVAKAGGPVDSFPADAVGYAASTNFGSGTQLGTGNYVLWMGSGQPARISGLTPDTVYHFRLFEFNGSGATANYNTNAAAANPIGQTTMAANPASAASSLALTAIGPTSFTVSWNKGAAGTNTLVLVKTSGIATDPADLTTYTASPTFGAGTQLDGASVVYTNTGTSVTVTDLSPGTRYYVRAYAFNGAAGAQNYRTSDEPFVDGYTLATEPAQASGLGFSSLGAISYAVSFAPGSGINRLVVAKQGSAVTFLPTDATAYAGENNNLGAAADLGGGNFLVHRGSSPFALSGLAAQTEYYLRIFEYAGDAATLNYNTNAAPGNPGNRYTLSTEPTAHASALTATALSDTQIRLTWTDATGESGYVVVRKSGSLPADVPADGTGYAQGNAVGDGTVVYVSTVGGAGSVTDSYATAASMAYYYELYPYAYDGTAGHATYNYLTTDPVPWATAATGASEPGTGSTLLSFLPVTSGSAILAWTNAGAADGTIILVKSGAAVDANPADWTNYAASAVFGGGAQIGTGNYVVFANAAKSGSVTVSGLSAGTTYHAAIYPFNGSGMLLNYRTTSPATGSLTILPAPTAQTATADGKTLVDLAWTKNASYDVVMIVYRAGSAPTEPTQGQAYAVGDACGGGTVIYTGSGAALEHVVASGTAHNYAFYSCNGSYYSAGATATAATTAFAAGEIVETFSYTNGTALTGRNGETGWGGGWYGDTGVFTNSSGSFSAQTNYPPPTGNKLWVSPANDANVAVFRPLGQSYNSGRIYVAYVLNFANSGTELYEGLSLYYSNSAEKVFFGEIGSQDKQLGIGTTGSSYVLNNGAGNDYVVVGCYDWAAGQAKAKAFKIGSQAVPTDEPASWDVTVSLASNAVGVVNSVRLAAGEYGAWSGTPGNTYFDEVRVATNWAGIVQVAPSKPADPTNQTAVADGVEMVRLAWTKNGAGNDVLVLHKTSAIATGPSDGVDYGVGSTIDGATVVSKGSATALEHVVSSGTTNFYGFYSVNSVNYFSPGVGTNQTMAVYADYERVNPFSYTNGTAFGTSMKGGQGFGNNYWVANSGTWKAQTNYATAAADVPKFMDMANYPAMAGNLGWVENPGDGQSATTDRDVSPAISSGSFYVAFMMAYQYYGANKWAGLSLMNGAAEKAFFGKGSGSYWSTLAAAAGSSTYWSSFDLLPFHSVGGNTGNVYLVVGKYDFGTKLLQTKGWKIIGNTFPETEPTSWDASGTLDTGIDQITRLRLNVGAGAGAGAIGRVFFDEIRYATNWDGLIAVRCPTWAGSNALNGAAWTAATNLWLGDSHDFQFQSWPVGLGQRASLDVDWQRNGTFSTSNAMAFWKTANNNSYWTNRTQMAVAGSITSRFTATAGSCSPARTNNYALNVQNLNPPTGASATRDGVNTNSQINLLWTRGISGGDKDALVVRQMVNAGWTAPANGTTYNAGDALGVGTVVYRGGAAGFNDAGLAPDTTYYYRFYSENWTYYSTNYAAASAATAPGTKTIVVDGNGQEWVAAAATAVDSSKSSLQEFVWTDKVGEMRPENADHPNADIREFRVYADSTWVYFLVRMSNVTAVAKPFVAIGVDTRTNAASTALNWLGDDSGLDVGGGYFEGDRAHYPEYQLNVHYVGADGGPRIEMWDYDDTLWHAPPTGSHTNVAISDAYDAIELKVPRADLNLVGAKVARFTVAAFLNGQGWNNSADQTVQVNADGSSDAVDTLSIPPWGVLDNAANLSAWAEDLGDKDIDGWFDVRFSATGLADNLRLAAPTLLAPTNTENVAASPNVIWQKPADDADGKITGYLLEVSTNELFNGAVGTENGAVDLRVHLDAATTNYQLSTSMTQYWWRVRARDTAGELSSATTRYFRVVGKLDTEGPRPTLVYIGTNVAGFFAGEYNTRIARYGYVTNVTDQEIQNSNNVFGFVLRWDDATGVYATNQMGTNSSTPGAFAYNIVTNDGRVSPNWDLVEIDTVHGTTNDLWGVDKPFYASNTLAAGGQNHDTTVTNWVAAAFSITNYDPTIGYYLTLSAEDAYSLNGSWWETWPSQGGPGVPYWSGYCKDGPNTMRNVTVNELIEIHVTDDDAAPPVASTNLGWNNGGASAALVVSNASARLAYAGGQGQDVLYEATDGSLTNAPLSFSFNAYDDYYQGVALGTNPTQTAGARILTNTFFVVSGWQTNWANFSPVRSVTTDTTEATTMLTWHWPALGAADITALWGAASPANAAGVTNLVQLDLFDIDNDRDDDQASDLVTFGHLRVTDDDPVDPTIAAMQVLGSGLAREYVLTNLVEWTFPSGTASLNASAVADNLTASDIANGPPGTTLQGTSNLYMNAQFYRPATNRYLTFTLTPAAGRTFKAESISFETRVSSANGPDVVELYGTMPGGAETLWATNAIDLYDPENIAGTNWNNYLVISSGVSVAMSAASTGTVSFKLLARVADTNHLVANENANWYIDNLTVSGYILGPEGGTQVTDQDLAQGTAKFTLSAYDGYSGLYAATNTGKAPRVDFWNAASNVCPVTNAFLTNGLAANGAATSATSITGAPPAADKKKIAVGTAGLVYQARFAVDDYDVDRDGDSRTATNGTTATVYDEDVAKPVRGYLYGGPLGVFVDGEITKAVASGNNREYRVNDEQLQTAAATSITVRLNLYDYSGWTIPTLSFSNAVAGAIATNGWLTGKNLAVNTTNQTDAALEWTFGQTQANALFNSNESVTNELRIASVWDKDDDRQDAGGANVDSLELANARIGYLTFLDNDVGLPNVQSNWSVARAGWIVPQVFLGQPGDAARSNLYLGGLPADTNSGAVLADLTNRVYDSQLAKVSAAAPLSVVLPLYDTGGGGAGRTIKGLQRGNAATESSANGGAHAITNTWLGLGAAAVSNVADFNQGMSSSQQLTRIAAQFPTSVWAFASFSYAQVGAWLPAGAAATNQAMTAGLFDADDNRPNDQQFRAVALGTLQVLDNDTVKPSLPTNLKVNGAAFVGVLDRDTAPWTNTPEFRVSFKPATDGAKAATDLEVTGVGEHRTATARDGIGPDLGVPLAVPAEGALANAGFESGTNNWTLVGAAVTAEQAYEGTNSVKMAGSSAQQAVALFNTNGYVPRVAVLGVQYRGAGTGTLTVDGLDTNGAVVGTFNVAIAGSAGQWTAGSSGATAFPASVDRVRATLNSAANTYWDDVQVKIEMLDNGTPVDEVSALFLATEQGLTTNYLFAVDRDNNRPGDRRASSAPGDAYVPAFGIAFDVTKPTPVPNVTASTESVDDPTTQFDLEWVADDVGPDDEANDPNYPHARFIGNDVLSPWKSYKIYFGTFAAEQVPTDDYLKNPADKYVYTNFVATGAYLAWSNVTFAAAIADPSAAGTNYYALTNAYQDRIRLYDLDYDQDYAVVVVGLDKAGNEGPAGSASWATNNTIRFAVTQGVLKARTLVQSAFPTNNNLRSGDRAAAALYWIAAGQTNALGGYNFVTKDYDLIYRDAVSFQESSNWTWQRVGTVRTNWFTDAPGQDLGLSGDRGQMRFYRASYKDRWQRTNVVTGLPQRPLASEDVYALHSVVLAEGNNYVALHGQPYTNTFLGVFGNDTNVWPAGASASAGATKIEFFRAGTNAPVTNVFWFRSDGEWLLSGNSTPVTTVLQPSNFFVRGFSITLPAGLASRGFATTNISAYDDQVTIPALVWHPILKVPTNGPDGDGFSQIIMTGASEVGRYRTNVYNLVALNLPVSLHPSNMNLVASGFTRAPAGMPLYGDEIYTWDTTRKAVRGGSSIYCDATGTWRFVNGNGAVSGPYFKPNDVIVILSRNRAAAASNSWTWTYYPTSYYRLPTRWMGQ